MNGKKLSEWQEVEHEKANSHRDGRQGKESSGGPGPKLNEFKSSIDLGKMNARIKPKILSFPQRLSVQICMQSRMRLNERLKIRL